MEDGPGSCPVVPRPEHVLDGVVEIGQLERRELKRFATPRRHASAPYSDSHFFAFPGQFALAAGKRSDQNHHFQGPAYYSAAGQHLVLEGDAVPRATSSQGSDQAALLAGLRKALSGVAVAQGPDGLFPTGAAGNRLVREATDRGYLRVHQQSLPAATPRGRPRKVDVAELTEQGRQFLLETDSPKAVLEALLPAVRALAPSSGKENESAAACVAAIREGFATFQRSVDAAFAKLEQTIRAAVAPGAARPAVDPATMLAALQAALAKLGAPAPAAHPTPPAPTPRPEPARQSAAPSREQVRQTLRAAYDHLRLFKEFRDGLVEMPRLYKEAAERLPGLTVEQFHRELRAMTDERKIELHKLNEVQQAKDRHLAIESNDRLYYYVFWK